MLVTVVAPEYILGKSAGDYWMARSMIVYMKEYAAEDKVEWILSHGFYANLGGFVGVEESEDEPAQSAGRQTRDDMHVLAHSQEETSNKEEVILIDGTAENIYSLAVNHIHWLRTPEDTNKPELPYLISLLPRYTTRVKKISSSKQLLYFKSRGSQSRLSFERPEVSPSLSSNYL